MILWLDQRPSASHVAQIGPKAASLCTLRRLGLRVPACFFVTTRAFREHLEAHDLPPRITTLQERLDAQPQDAPGVLEEIRRLIAEPPLTDHLHEQIAAAYNKLGATTVSVRSSATAEDLPGHSFAGQYETILGVTSREDCLDAVKRCWASLWTDRAFEYRRRNGIDHRHLEMAVIVQRQVEPAAAGVAFTLDPLKGSRSRIVIESCRGLGEALVSGQVQPDRLVLRKKNLDLVRRSRAAEEPSLDLPSARRLARCVRRLERKLGGPQDVEWALRAGKLWFLQTRPITAIPPQKSWEDRQVWTNVNTGEVAPDVMTPGTWSMIRLLFNPFFCSFCRLFGAAAAGNTVAGLVAGRIYFNVNVSLALGRPFGLGPTNAEKFEFAFGGAQTKLYHLGEVDIADEDLPDLGFRWPRYVLSWPRIAYDLLTHSPRRGDKARARIRARSDALRRLDPEKMSTTDLAGIIRTSLLQMVRDANLLYLATGVPTLLVFERACRRWLGDQETHLAYRLMAAQGGLADTEAGLEMWRLAELAHADRQTETMLLTGNSWSALRAALAPTPHGSVFLQAWDRFMTEHGHHCRGELEFFNARWSEWPDYVLGLVQNYLRSIDRINPVENHRRLAREREDLVEQCRRRLRNPVRRVLFNWSLHGAGKLAVDRENWKNEVVRLLAALRPIFLVLGTRFRQAGILTCTDDIFFLELPEIESLGHGGVDFDVGRCVAERRAEYERNRSFTPPPVVVGRFDPQRHILPEVDATVKELKGLAVSPGTATGKARVILRTDDHQHVEVGEILVAPFTDPAWTPYFLPAAGVVMDQGGILSHGAIIAREYGIPAVVNVGPASRMIRTGQLLRVDGDRGTVTLLDDEIRSTKHEIRNKAQ
jgi:phosphohistidine swiveling domain-containing protein